MKDMTKQPGYTPRRTLHLMVGLPRSGKSTLAKKLGIPIVEPDAIRTVLHGTPWKPNMEAFVWASAHLMVESLFEAGHEEVVVDATNHTKRRRDEWINPKWAVQIHMVPTSAEECQRRATATNQEYLIPVITKMASEWEEPGGVTNG